MMRDPMLKQAAGGCVESQVTPKYRQTNNLSEAGHGCFLKEQYRRQKGLFFFRMYNTIIINRLGGSLRCMLWLRNHNEMALIK